MKTSMRSVLTTLTFLCFAVEPKTQAVAPPPDGGYPGFNTAEGQNALFGLTTGAANTAVGWFSLFSNAEGNFNTATGAGALLFNTARENTAFGAAALLFNTTGAANTAIGTAALLDNTEGVENTATGDSALHNNTTGSNNTANGFQALVFNTSGDRNTATGWQALLGNTGANNNTAHGFQALHNTNAGNNTGIGFDALETNTTGNNNTAVGANALKNATGSNNTALGGGAGVNVMAGNNNIEIGNSGGGADDNTIRIGLEGTQTQTFIAGIRGVTTGFANAVNVLIDSAGQLGTMNSSRRFKHNIKPIDSASEAILSLNPVTFHYKSDITSTPQYGLIAEEVAEVNPDLVVRDEKGDIYTVRYEAVNAMLLNEFLKEHRAFVEERRKVEKLEAAVAALVATVKEQAAQIQKVNAYLETDRPAMEVVSNDR